MPGNGIAFRVFFFYFQSFFFCKSYFPLVAAKRSVHDQPLRKPTSTDCQFAVLLR